MICGAWKLIPIYLCLRSGISEAQRCAPSSMDHNGGEAVSPIDQILSTSPLCIHAIFELEQPIDVSTMKKAIMDILLPCHPRFCCIMQTEDTHGVLHWVKTEVNVDDHVIVPHFPPGQTEYDEFVKDYICHIHPTPLPKNRPLWEFHFLNYNTSKARATLIINMHHSLGDGTSLMPLCFCCVTKAEDPNLPLTCPTSKSLPSPPPYSWLSTEFMYYMLHRLFVLVLVLWYTVSDFISLLRMMWMGDSKLPIRGPPGRVEMLPKVMSHVTFPIDDVKRIKNSIGGDIKDMIKPESGAPWGNHFRLLHIPMPTANAESPLDFVRRAKNVTDRKKMSLKLSVTSRLVGCPSRQASADAALTISNMIGPMEKIAIDQIPVKNMFFSISGLPQTLLLTVVSYMGKLRLEVIGVKGYVNSDILAKCFGECF